jgi:Zn-dependent peptidase ImmA (M78 family)/transcriptional regulator with XRE-family HTH domain
MPRINPAILRWARETAGLSLEEAAERISLAEARGVSGSDRLAALEVGEVEPSRALLVRMAKQYRRPLLVFYLAEPPRKGYRGQDFRTLPDDYVGEQEPVLDALLRDILARQALLKSALEEEDEAERLPWIGAARMADGVTRVVGMLRDALALPLVEYRSAADSDDAFALLRERTERLGAFVVLISNLGSHHTGLGVEVFRGLAIADPIAPFIVINDQDSRAAWSFTLLHELTHLWLGLTGVSDSSIEREVERFCNEVASEFLVPSDELAAVGLAASPSLSDLEESITTFARVRRVSRSLVAYRLYRNGQITELQWSRLTRLFRQQWLNLRDRERETSRKEGGGPNYYVVRRHRLGKILPTTGRLLRSGAITTTKAGRVLGVKPGNVGVLLAESPGRTGKDR